MLVLCPVCKAEMVLVSPPSPYRLVADGETYRLKTLWRCPTCVSCTECGAMSPNAVCEECQP